MRLVGSTVALLRTLLASLPERCIQRDAQDTRSALVEDGVLLSIAPPGNGEDDIRASHVITAALPSLLEATVDFTPGLEPSTARLGRETPTWLAPHRKFFALYERSFWRDGGLSGTAQSMVGPMMEIHDATTASGQPALLRLPRPGSQLAWGGRRDRAHPNLPRTTRPDLRPVRSRRSAACPLPGGR